MEPATVRREVASMGPTHGTARICCMLAPKYGLYNTVHVRTLLGNDREICNYATAVATQWLRQEW
jgi:hypothetical protein